MGREPIVPLSPNPSSEQDFAAIPPSPSTLAPFPVAVGPRVLGSAHEGESAAVHASRLLPSAPGLSSWGLLVLSTASSSLTQPTATAPLRWAGPYGTGGRWGWGALLPGTRPALFLQPERPSDLLQRALPQDARSSLRFPCDPRTLSLGIFALLIRFGARWFCRCITHTQNYTRTLRTLAPLVPPMSGSASACAAAPVPLRRCADGGQRG